MEILQFILKHLSIFLTLNYIFYGIAYLKLGNKITARYYFTDKKEKEDLKPELEDTLSDLEVLGYISILFFLTDLIIASCSMILFFKNPKEFLKDPLQ